MKTEDTHEARNKRASHTQEETIQWTLTRLAKERASTARAKGQEQARAVKHARTERAAGTARTAGQKQGLDRMSEPLESAATTPWSMTDGIACSMLGIPFQSIEARTAKNWKDQLSQCWKCTVVLHRDCRRYVTQRDFVKCGYTDECPACTQLATALRSAKVPHDDW